MSYISCSFRRSGQPQGYRDRASDDPWRLLQERGANCVALLYNILLQNTSLYEHPVHVTLLW